MTDREKVIAAYICQNEKLPDKRCEKCPYGYDYLDQTGDNYFVWCNIERIMVDAIDLLKAQEPIEARLHLCDSCTKLYPECDATADGIEFGCGVGNDNIIVCTAYENRWKAQEPRIVTESDFDGADEYGYLPVWAEEKDGDMYCECIPKIAITDPDGIGVVRYWTSRPDQATREATPWN